MKFLTKITFTQPFKNGRYPIRSTELNDRQFKKKKKSNTTRVDRFRITIILGEILKHFFRLNVYKSRFSPRDSRGTDFRTLRVSRTSIISGKHGFRGRIRIYVRVWGGGTRI